MNKKQLNNAAQTKIEPYKIADGVVYVRELNGLEMMELAKDINEEMSHVEGNMILLIHTLCTKDRKRYYTAKERHLLEGWGSSTIRPLVDIAYRLNGMGKSEREGIAKN